MNVCDQPVAWCVGKWSGWFAAWRWLDVQFLWPCCRAIEPDLHRARVHFAIRISDRPHWLALDDEEIQRLIGELL